MSTPTLTAARVRELLDYDPLTGIFRWRVNRGIRPLAGCVAGNINPKGYITIGIDRKKYKASRVAWLIVTGTWPDHEIDHEDTNKANNRFTNLRDRSHQFNMENYRRSLKTNKLGILGVHLDRNGLFRAQISMQKRKTHLGYYATPELAHGAYLAAKRVLHPGNTL